MTSLAVLRRSNVDRTRAHRRIVPTYATNATMIQIENSRSQARSASSMNLPPPTPRRVLTPLLVFLTLVSVLSMPTAAHSQTPQAPAQTATHYNPADLLAIKQDLREDVAAILPEGLTTYNIALTFPEDAISREFVGSQNVTYTNTTGETLTSLPFRLYANSVVEENDAITIDHIKVNGEDVSFDLRINNSVAMIALPTPLAAGESADIDMGFTTRVGQDDPRHYGIFNYASATETWSLAHWYPVIAGRDPDTGWMLKPTSIYGDPIFTDTGLYTVSVTAPKELQLITSGVETDATTTGLITTTTFNAWPSRDFVIIADADMEVAKQVIDGTEVSSWFHPGYSSSGESVLLWSSQALEQFNTLLGEYPYRQLQVTGVEIYNAAGVEFPQLIAVDQGYYRSQRDASHPSYFEFTVAHEVVHQWFYNLVGNNQYDHAFIDESLTNHLSSQVYFEEFWGADQAAAMVERSLANPFRNAVEASSDPIVDFPTDDFPTQGSYIVAAYNKGPLGFAAIHDAMGDDAFFAGLRHYVENFRFRVATPQDLLAAFEAASDVSVQPIWVHWFEQRNGPLDLRD